MLMRMNLEVVLTSNMALGSSTLGRGTGLHWEELITVFKNIQMTPQQNPGISMLASIGYSRSVDT